ncbi:hypothetical protein [Nocardioides piscis]|uniref:GH16 domain-containing protein n=1 Tax=Nocardioides piscis TaxID=2714938 RepID=A0A6G7YGJ4_9ACTN|nr:hypothetical protein [Nocardioides piscis]QIK75935.1 hypothetical protein G7071_11265 [Nocardioides piscis]
MLHSRTALALAACGLVLTMAPAVASTVETADARASSLQLRGTASLTTSPSSYVGGQAITFSGNIGTSGKRKVTLQLHMNRPGDNWFGVRGFSGAKTLADGSFSFQFQAPSMFGIRYRVVSGKRATPPVSFNARLQDVTTWVEGTNPDYGLDHNQAVAGEPFTVMADATVDGAPVFVGRGLTLQRRLDGDSWEDLGRSSVGADGNGAFPGVSLPAGVTVVRVVADEISSGANRIGWIQSFPAYVNVLASAPAPEQARSPKQGKVATTSARAVALAAPSARRGAGAASATASSKYGWYPILSDYTWEAGQSLTSPADLGSDRDGWWLDYADGAGRVSKHNGGLYLDSQRNRSGPGDFGTTRATLMDSARAYGRWETRVRLTSGESSSTDFRVLVELVPDRAADYACGRRNITVAEVSAHGTSMSFGAKADTAQWTGSKSIPSVIHSSPAVAVEVSKRHITWFLNGKPIGTVKGKAAVSDVPMTLRFSLVGDQAGEYDKTGLHSDWQRGFGIDSGKLVTKGPALKKSALTACES